MRPAQRRGDGGGPYDGPQTPAPAGDVRQESHLQDRRWDGCRCEILELIAQSAGHHAAHYPYLPLRDIEEAYRLFESRADGVIKVAGPRARRSKKEHPMFKRLKTKMNIENQLYLIQIFGIVVTAACAWW